MTGKQYWVDGVAGGTVDADDRALHYGDGVFETIRVRDSSPEFLDCHLDRLVAGCERLGFPPVDRDALKRELLQRATGYPSRPAGRPMAGPSKGRLR